MAATNLWSFHSEKHFWFFWTFFLHHWTTVMPFWFWLNAQVHHPQVSASTECRCSHRQRRSQVRPRPVSSSARRAALAECSSAHFKLCASIHRCLQSRAPQHMTECCIPFSDITSRQHLRSAVLPPAVRTSLPAFDVRSSGLLCG